MSGVEVEAKDTGASDLMRKISSLGQSVTVGIHGDARDYPDGTPVVVVGATHEFGSSTVPQRSWLRGWLDTDGAKKIADAGERALGEVVDGSQANSVSEKIGELAVKGIVERMDRGIAGAGGAPIRELEQTRHLKDSITFEVSQ